MKPTSKLWIWMERSVTIIFTRISICCALYIPKSGNLVFYSHSSWNFPPKSLLMNKHGTFLILLSYLYMVIWPGSYNEWSEVWVDDIATCHKISVNISDILVYITIEKTYQLILFSSIIYMLLTIYRYYFYN